MKTELQEQLVDIAERALDDFEDLFFVELRLKGNEGNLQLRILIDGEPTLSIDQCAVVSRRISEDIDKNNMIPGRFTIEVSSPGVDNPLVLRRQYVKNQGRNLKLELENGIHLQGRLDEIVDKGIMIQTKYKKEEIQFDQIRKAQVLVSFN